MKPGRPPTGDEPIQPTPEQPPAPGLEGLPRTDIGVVEAAAPRLLDAAVRGPLVLTRHGHDAFVLLPIDAYRRLWQAAPRPPVIDSE